ncbi:MAG TPA: RNA 2',3'-cyclic phosphodiesterase [Pirellulales bacterium]|jgi:2'-5' RNA ligase|nr:RNA 2',3'-cyclic phosphodiesterase [Pirellulales bacterium]
MRRRVRTFVAIELPPEVRRRACQLIESLRRATETDVRWVTPEQLHWTLKFLGDVDLLEIPNICRRLSQAVAPLAPFDIEAHGAGAFPDPLHPRTVWIGMRQGLEPMLALHATVENVLADLGFRQEQRRYRPHITLGRIRKAAAGGQQEFADRLKQYADFDAGIAAVFEVAIFSSQSGPHGPIYEPLGHAELAARPRGR